jgi:hypothetical protein
MPRETVWIRISSLPSPEPVATFLSRLAYPDESYSCEQNEFWLSIYRRASLAHSAMDPELRIRPGLFMSSKVDGKVIRSGYIKLKHRFMAAYPLIAMLRKHLVGSKRAGPGVTELRRRTMCYMGLQPGSKTTFSGRTSSPSRPVVHAAGGCLLAILASHSGDDQVNHRYNDDLPSIDDLIDFFAFPELLKRAVIFSELIRQNLPVLKELKIKEQQTIQFLPE